MKTVRRWGFGICVVLLGFGAMTRYLFLPAGPGVVDALAIEVGTSRADIEASLGQPQDSRIQASGSIIASWELRDGLVSMVFGGDKRVLEVKPLKVDWFNRKYARIRWAAGW
jgi:hypothetical protein